MDRLMVAQSSYTDDPQVPNGYDVPCNAWKGEADPGIYCDRLDGHQPPHRSADHINGTLHEWTD
jgi:hypothetical protein